MLEQLAAPLTTAVLGFLALRYVWKKLQRATASGIGWTEADEPDYEEVSLLSELALDASCAIDDAIMERTAQSINRALDTLSAVSAEVLRCESDIWYLAREIEDEMEDADQG